MVKQLKTYACGNTTSNSANTEFNLGHFMHAINPYKTDPKFHPNISQTFPSEKIAFPAGCLVIPTGKILMQVLALPQEVISHGLKIIQINSDEETISNPDIYYRFMVRNKNLNCGYYKRTMKEEDIKKMNQKDSTHPTAAVLKQQETFSASMGMAQSTPTQSPTPSGILYIDDVDNDDNFKGSNIFQNGEPLTFVEPDDEADKDQIGMKIFYLNPILINYIQSMLNIEANLQKQNKNQSDNNNNENYLKHFPTFHLVTGTFYDFLTMAFFTEMNHDGLMDIPPLNDKCVFCQNNIMIVNKHGNCIMVSKDTSESDDANICTIFRRLLRNQQIPLSHKIVPTVSSKSVSIRGNSPQSKFNVQTLESVTKGFQHMKDTDKIEAIKNKYGVLLNHHGHQSQEYHQSLKNSSDGLKNYFCKFKDDMDEDVELKGNESIFDIALNIYPETVTQSSSNKKKYTLDFSQKSVSKPIIDREFQPNMVYVKNLGFVTVLSVCDMANFTLKNAEVYLENLIGRGNKNYINKTSENCGYNKDDIDDYDDPTMTYHSVKITQLPKKRKFPETIIDLAGVNNSDFDHQAYTRMGDCPNSVNFDSYAKTLNYSKNNQNCLRNV